MSAPEAKPLADRLRVVDDQEPGPPAWMERITHAAEPLGKVLDQSRVPDDPLAEPRVRAEIDAAVAEASDKAWSETSAEASDRYDALTSAVRDIDAMCSSAFRLQASEIVELALLVAGELLGRELAADIEAITEIVHQSVRTIAGPGSVTIRLHPDDLAEIEARGTQPDPDHGIATLVPSPSLKRGEAEIETADQQIDARVEARLDGLRESLIQLIGAAC